MAPITKGIGDKPKTLEVTMRRRAVGDNGEVLEEGKTYSVTRKTAHRLTSSNKATLGKGLASDHEGELKTRQSRRGTATAKPGERAAG